ncbi:Molybdopterin synthase sulfurylase [Ceraceosorus bombacis]|uniref:Molybdopterin synthase sulfurylase n=1 Tax=Ceraceosorus bombacis TaxID=401625 RepID=A0A0P1BNV8_9BASI|nr:Molybdopterin synthase sulfurylase [Ceraceosorus bombacis]
MPSINTMMHGQSTTNAAWLADQQAARTTDDNQSSSAQPSSLAADTYPLCLSEYTRYGRQLILPSWGMPTQLALKRSRVLVVGAGGLGCPAIQYLAAAGVGHITVVDHDVVERSNLARQILHDEATVGLSKVESVERAVQRINPHVRVDSIASAFDKTNAMPLVSSHDLTLDCTDNVLTRYLISDTAVLCSKQVVSGAAQGVEGQLMVLNKNPHDSDAAAKDRSSAAGPSRGPCYRCMFPRAPRPDDVVDCSDGGVFGGITGLVGTLQAVESIKLLSDVGESTPPNLLLCSAFSYPPFRSIKLRPSRPDCRSCGNPENVESRISNLAQEDYAAFCGLNDVRGKGESRGGRDRISVQELSSILQHEADTNQANARSLLVDVRPKVEYGIVSLPNTCNIPYTDLRRNPSETLQRIRTLQNSVAPISSSGNPSNHSTSKLNNAASQVSPSIYLLCRRGNDSQIAADLLHKAQVEQAPTTGNEEVHTLAAQRSDEFTFVDVIGGLQAWSKEVDLSFPVY